ncbi:unnamed protein product [Ixodes pacificus]
MVHVVTRWCHVPDSGTCRPCMHADIVNRTNLDGNSELVRRVFLYQCARLVPGMHTTREASANLPPTTMVGSGGRGAGISAERAPNTVKLSDTLRAEDFYSFTVLATSSPSRRNPMESAQKNPHREDSESATTLSLSPLPLAQRHHLWQDALLVIVPLSCPATPRSPRRLRVGF